MNNTKFLKFIGISTFLVIISCVLYIEYGFNVSSSYANLGSLLGGIFGPTLAFASIVLFLKDLTLQRKELRLQREELKGTREIHSETLNQIKRQSSEDTKFKSLDYYNLRVKIINENINRISYGGLKGISAIIHMAVQIKDIDQHHFETEISFYYHVIIQNLDEMAFEAGEDYKKFVHLFSLANISASDIHEYQVLNKYLVFRNSFSAIFISCIDHINKKIEDFPSFKGKEYPSIRLLGNFLQNKNQLPAITDFRSMEEMF